jgi:hypothetical protein
MPNRIGSNRIGSMIPGTLYATLALTLLASSPAAGEDNCLAGPNADPPQGSHWYYYHDRALERRCWYLGPQRRPARHAQSDAQPTAKSAEPAFASIEAPVPPPRPVAAPDATAPADVEGFVERAREPTAAVMPPPEPVQVAGTSERETLGASLRQEVTAPGKATTPAAASALDPVTIILILIAGAAAAAGILNHVIFSAKAARPFPARVKGGRAGRIASLASERAPRAFAAPRPNIRKRAPAEPADGLDIAEGFQELVRAVKSRAA